MRALCQIAENLGLETVAESVESEAVAERLHALGVRFAQGYLWGWPQPLGQCLDTLRGQAAADFIKGRARVARPAPDNQASNPGASASSPPASKTAPVGVSSRCGHEPGRWMQPY